MKKQLFPLSTLALALTLGGAAHAQSGPAADTVTPAIVVAQQGAEFSDVELANYAAAHDTVQRLQADHAAQLNASDNDPDETARLEQELQEKTVQAIEDAGMDLDAYEQIDSAAQNDPQLQERIREATLN